MEPTSLTADQRTALLGTLQERFERNEQRHPGIDWEGVQTKLEADDAKLTALFAMEDTGGEPDVVTYDLATNEYVFYDCAPETPVGRRNLCYDREAWESRKRNKPRGNAVDEAADMGVEMLTEAQYYALQELGEVDVKTSSWVETPEPVRALGGALFCDRRFNRVFTFHNGAESYYASRGFRASLRV
jgi:hypothetical protein